LAVGSVSDFGMVLNAIDPTVCIFDDRCWGVDSGSTNDEPGWGFGDGVEVGHPYGFACGDLIGQ
jgi:hypothetical protein